MTGQFILLNREDDESPERVAWEIVDSIRRVREMSPDAQLPYVFTTPAEIRRLRRLTYRNPETGEPEPDDYTIELVKRYRAGATVRQLAELAGISKSSMGRILKGTARLPFDVADLPEIQAA